MEQTVDDDVLIITNVTSDLTIDAVFSIQTFVVTLNVGENGNVTTTPEILIGLLADTEVVFTIIPDEGYELDEFKVDGEAVKKWIANGAQPTEVVSKIFKLAGIEK